MNILKYRELSEYEVKNSLSTNLNLIYDQKLSIEKWLIGKKVVVSDKKFSSTPPSILARLLTPLMIITIILLYTVILPLKWVITGKFKMDYQTKLGKLMRKFSEFFKIY